ncbi:hypothetical protein BU25DRAFT_348240 [Macroventuria anomochaeta]|uniref:Uncharacterized protein n=1 Tax=Macroventuria anomochaeta TaxID=301207 RepID=A0ACB6RTU8_9PLEO|nr:uncharacterized protein BU25DRAFT_348240 [Macroventuria anomochaeta]KAF2624369.1 hypothetical protein BU25DRAFT_348240 [Macroventuria anomochaeta]
MQFSLITITAALAAVASAQYTITNGTSTSAVAPYPSASGTVSVKPSGTGSVKPTSSTAPFEGAASQLTGSAMGLIVAGGIALML